MPSLSDLKSVKRSEEVTWSKSGVSALYISAWALAPGPGSWICPDGRMFRAMRARSLATALEQATNAQIAVPMMTRTRLIRDTFPLSSQQRSSLERDLDATRSS